MGVKLSKGSKVSLAKAAEEAGIGTLKNVIVGLGWEANRYDGGAAFDLDASAFMLGANGKCRSEKDFIFYGNLTGPGIQHMGDEKTGASDGDDEQIKISLQDIPADVERIAFTVTIHEAVERSQNFGMVESSYVRLADADTGVEALRFELGEEFSIETAVVFCELYRHNGEWKFNSIASGYEGGLAALCDSYGIAVE